MIFSNNSAAAATLHDFIIAIMFARKQLVFEIYQIVFNCVIQIHYSNIYALRT